MSTTIDGYDHYNLTECSILNFVVPAENTGKWESFVSFCFGLVCPCLAMGCTDSEIARDKHFTRFKLPCLQCYLGNTCLHTCITVTPLCLCGWIFSPALGYYIGTRRQKLMDTYNDIPMQFPIYKFIFLWPCVLYQNSIFIEKKKRLGLLKFINENELANLPSTFEKKVIIIGAEGSGKTAVFNRLLHLLPNQSSNRNNEFGHATTGLRAYDVSSSRISFISATDIPTVKLNYHSYLDTINTHGIDYILICCDITNGESLLLVEDIINKTGFMNGERIILSLKVDLRISSEDKRELKSSILSSVKLLAQNQGYKCIEVSTVSNVGVGELIRLITDERVA